MRDSWGILLAFVLFLASCAGPPDAASTVEADTWFVEVEGEGGCWLGPESLHGVGIDPAGAPALRLSWSGSDVRHLPVHTAEGWGVFFFAPDRSTRYTRRTAFRLEAGADGAPMASGEAPAALSPGDGGLVTTRRERDARYVPQAEAEVPWLWEPLYAPAAVTHTVALTGALPGPITVTLDVWSHTALPVDPDHALRLRWDGRTVGEWAWDGRGMQRLTASLAEERPEGEHTLVIEAPLPPAVGVAVAWLDSWELGVRRRVMVDGGVWQAAGAGVRVEGSKGGERLLDVTDPFAPVDLGTVEAGGTVGTVPGHRYWLGRPEEAPGPVTVRVAEAVEMDELAGAEYLALAPAEFHAALADLLEHRRSQGLAAAVVSPQAVYDSFGSGRPDPAAVRALVGSLPTLRYLLLVGDGTVEPWGYDGEAGALRVVVPFVRTEVLGETPADALLGADGEGRPAVAVGRFPAASAREVETMGRKTVEWEARGDWPVALLLSDDEPVFAALMDEVAVLLPDGEEPLRLSTGDEGARAGALAALREGGAWLNYAGHGSLTLLGDEGALAAEDGNAWRDPALVVVWACLAGYSVHPSQDSLAETWLRARRGGAVAFLGPVGETTVDEQAEFARTFYRALAEGGRLGDGWLAALRAGGSQDVAWGTVLLGDPALGFARR